MVPSVRLRIGPLHTITSSTTAIKRRSESMWWCQLSSIFRIFLCIGMVPMIFPESEALRTNLSLFGITGTATTTATTLTDIIIPYYDYTTATKAVSTSSFCFIRPPLPQQLQEAQSLVSCPSSYMMRPRSIGSLIDAAHSIGRIRTQFQQSQHHRCYRNRYYFVNDPVFAMLSWMIAVVSSSCILLWSKFYRWKFTILIGIVATTAFHLTPITTTTTTIISTLGRMFGTWYMSNLHTNPMITKSISAGLIGTIADYGAQWLEHMLHPSKQQQQSLRLTETATTPTNTNTGDGGNIDETQQYSMSFSSSTTTTTSLLYTTISIHGRYDTRRGISTLMDGLFISGPLMHVGYDLFESILPIHGSSSGNSNSSDTSGWIAAMLHVIADSVLLDSFFVASKFFTTGLMEGITVHNLVQQFYSTYIPSLQASWITSILLCPIQLSCFCYLPLRFRVLSVNIIDVVWDAVLSFMTHRSR